MHEDMFESITVEGLCI